MIFEYLALAIFAGLMLAGAWLDFSTRRLPNSLCLATLIAGAIAVLVSIGLPGLGSSALHALVTLVIGMILFKFGIIGGGDAKFYAATAMWFPLGMALHLLLYIALSAFLVVIVWIVAQLFSGSAKKGPKGRSGKGVPFGIAIALGAAGLSFRQFYMAGNFGF